MGMCMGDRYTVKSDGYAHDEKVPECSCTIVIKAETLCNGIYCIPQSVNGAVSKGIFHGLTIGF